MFTVIALICTMHIVVDKQPAADILVALARLVLDRWEQGSDRDGDASALNLLVHADGLSVTELARQLGLSHSATVRVVDRLVRRGLARRDHSPRGRLLLVQPTVSGRRTVGDRLARQQRWLAEALGALPQPRRRQLLTDLGAVAAAMTGGRDDADRACRSCDQTTCLARGCPLAHLTEVPE
jgi:MarR family transcriptional regulator, negative regulator of the multidrug operon emrRAB